MLNKMMSMDSCIHEMPQDGVDTYYFNFRECVCSPLSSLKLIALMGRENVSVLSTSILQCGPLLGISLGDPMYLLLIHISC